MTKADRDEIARLMLIEIVKDEKAVSDDIGFAFLQFLATNLPPEDMLPWMLGYLGHGEEYLHRTGAISSKNQPSTTT